MFVEPGVLSVPDEVVGLVVCMAVPCEEPLAEMSRVNCIVVNIVPVVV